MNYQQTPNNGDTQTAQGDTKSITIQLQAMWDANGIGAIARKNGITDVYYADLETISVLFGVWEQNYVHIYGE